MAVIDGGKVIEQRYSSDALAFQYEYFGNIFQLQSGAYQCGNVASVKINGFETAINAIGTNIVVFNKRNNEVIDSICFDGYGGYKFYHNKQFALNRVEKRVIFNADDFGFTKGINRAIENCHKKGTLNSTTLLANAPAFDDAVEISKRNPNLRVGVHLNITLFSPLCLNVPSLVDKKGHFINVEEPISKRDISEIRREWLAQIDKVLAAGITPSHIDSHHHIHMKPELGELVREIVGKYSLPMRNRLPVKGVITPGKLVSTSTFKKLSDLLNSLEEFKNSTMDSVEYCCHPSIIDEDYLSVENWTTPRINDYVWLYVNSDEIVRFCTDNDLQISNFGDLL